MALTRRNPLCLSRGVDVVGEVRRKAHAIAA
jgi:hypothetical protein